MPQEASIVKLIIVGSQHQISVTTIQGCISMLFHQVMSFILSIIFYWIQQGKLAILILSIKKNIPSGPVMLHASWWTVSVGAWGLHGNGFLPRFGLENPVFRPSFVYIPTFLAFSPLSSRPTTSISLKVQLHILFLHHCARCCTYSRKSLLLISC